MSGLVRGIRNAVALAIPLYAVVGAIGYYGAGKLAGMFVRPPLSRIENIPDLPAKGADKFFAPFAATNTKEFVGGKRPDPRAKSGVVLSPWP